MSDPWGKRFGRAELGIARWKMETMAQWGCIVAEVASEAYRKWQIDTQGGAASRKSMIGGKVRLGTRS